MSQICYVFLQLITSVASCLWNVRLALWSNSPGQTKKKKSVPSPSAVSGSRFYGLKVLCLECPNEIWKWKGVFLKPDSEYALTFLTQWHTTRQQRWCFLRNMESAVRVWVTVLVRLGLSVTLKRSWCVSPSHHRTKRTTVRPFYPPGSVELFRRSTILHAAAAQRRQKWKLPKGWTKSRGGFCKAIPIGMKEAERAKSLVLKRGPDRRGDVISIFKPAKRIENIFIAEIITVTEA